MQETGVRSFGQKDPLEKEMATSIAWEIPWSEKPGGLQSMGSQKKIGHDLATKKQQNEWCSVY